MIENNEITILIVDDEEGIRDMMEMNFELEGFKVVKASGGRAALEIIKNSKIDFVLSDVRMPEGDGFTLLKEIIKMNLKLPTVLLLTGFAEISRDEVIAEGGIDLLQKPPDIEVIIKMIKQTISDIRI
jgi:DNA-binding NtrC family response regulator